MKLISKLMAALVVAGVLCAAIPAEVYGQPSSFPATPIFVLPLNPTATTTTTAWQNMSLPPNQDVHYWTLTWYALTALGTVPTCQIKVQKASDNLGTGAADLIADQACTSTGEVLASTSGDANFVRINVDTKTGLGQVSGVLKGFAQDPGGVVKVNVVSGTISIGSVDVGVAQGSTTSGQIGPLNQAAATTNPPSYSNGTTNPLSLDLAGNLRVNVAAGSAGNAAASATGSAVPASGSYTGINVGGTLRGVTGTNTSGSVYGMDVNIVGGSSGNAAASATGSAVPSSASYAGLNVAGTLRGQTGTNTSGSVYAGDANVVGEVGVGATGSAVPAQSGYAGVNVGGTLRGVTGTNTSGSVYGMDVNVVGGTISGGNAAASATGSAVPASASYGGLNVGGTLRGQTGTNTSGSVYAADVNVVAGVATGVTQGSTTSGQSGPLVQGAVTTSNPSYTTAQTSPLSLDTAGNLRVAAPGIVFNATQPTKADGQTFNDVQVTTRGALIVNPGVETFEVAPIATASTTDTALDCNVKSGTGTLADTTNHANCKASAGNLYGYEAVNTSATLAYLRIYNLTTDPTCSSSTGFVRSIPIPASATGAGIVRAMDIATGFSTGLSYCVTGGGANNDNSAPPAGVFISLKYK